MPDGFIAPSGVQSTAQRGIPRGRFPRGRFPGRRFPRGRFPRRIPRRRFPRPIIVPFFFGFPRYQCYWIDQFGRCCDRYGRCCDRYGRCEYINDYEYDRYPPMTALMNGWYGIPGSWDMMSDIGSVEDIDDNE